MKNKAPLINLVRVFKAIISAVSGSITALKETNSFPDFEEPEVREFDKQYKVFKIVEAEIHKEGDKKFGNNSVTKLTVTKSRLQVENNLEKKSQNDHIFEKDFISETRYQFKNKERIMRDLMLK